MNSSTRASNKAQDNLEIALDRLRQGEKLEFKCHQVTQGLISNNIMSNKKFGISLSGEIMVYEWDPSNNKYED